MNLGFPRRPKLCATFALHTPSQAILVIRCLIRPLIIEQASIRVALRALLSGLEGVPKEVEVKFQNIFYEP